MKTVKYKSNLCGGVFSIVLGAVIYCLVPIYIGTESAATKMYGINSRTVPYCMAILLIVCGIILLVQSLILKKDTVRELSLNRELVALIYMVLLVVSLVIYQHSFVLAMLLLGFSTLAILRCKKVLYYIIVAAMVFALFFLFSGILHVRLPALFLA